jgi:hypothetical protein
MNAQLPSIIYLQTFMAGTPASHRTAAADLVEHAGGAQCAEPVDQANGVCPAWLP